MPRIVARSGTAARRSDQLLSFSPKSAERRLFSSAQFRLPSQTNKAVNPIRLSSAGVQTRMNHNDRGVICQNTIAPSTRIFSRIFSCLEIKFQADCEKFLSDFSDVRCHARRGLSVRQPLWITLPGHEHRCWHGFQALVLDFFTVTVLCYRLRRLENERDRSHRDG